jgi:hypothetical protein
MYAPSSPALSLSRRLSAGTATRLKAREVPVTLTSLPALNLHRERDREYGERSISRTPPECRWSNPQQVSTSQWTKPPRRRCLSRASTTVLRS